MGLHYPGIRGVIISRYKDPYKPISTMECQPRVLLPSESAYSFAVLKKTIQGSIGLLHEKDERNGGINYIKYLYNIYIYLSGQSITTSHDLTPKGSLVGEFPLFQGNLGW